MDDGYSRLILLAGVVLFFLAAGVAIWRFIKSRQENVTEEDIMDMVNEGHEQGVLESSEAEMITNIFEFDDKEAGDIMTHRKNIVALDGSMSLREAAHFVLKEAKNSRYPVYGKDLDDIIGTVHMRDVLFHAENLQESRMEIANVPGVLRPAHFIPETRNIMLAFSLLPAVTSAHSLPILVNGLNSTRSNGNGWNVCIRLLPFCQDHFCKYDTILAGK